MTVTHGDGSPVHLSGHKQQLLLTMFVLHTGTWISRRRLAEVLWADAVPVSAMANLKTYVWHLRRLLPDPVRGSHRIEARRGEYRFVADRDEIDMLAFDDLLERGRQSRLAGDQRAARQSLDQAVALWRGEPLEGLALPEVLLPERSRLEEKRWSAVEELSEVRLDLGEHEQLVTHLRRVAMQRPLRERPWGQLMLALHRCGRQAEALDVYRDVCRILDVELGIQPGPQLRQIHGSITGDGADAAAASPRTGSPAGHTPLAYLPADLTSFTGRDGELAGILDLADQGSGITISAIHGTPGAGKTSLAVHAAHRLAPYYPGGQLFIDLHGHAADGPPVDPAAAVDRLLRALGVPTDRIPADPDERGALYREILATRPALIVLDDAAGEHQLDTLLPTAPGCFVLVTSRHRLVGLDDAHHVAVDALPVAEAIELFCRVVGSRRVAGRAAVVEEIVEMCDRLPLAIRIAAERLRARPSWSLDHLADRLRGDRCRLLELSAGQRSVAAALNLSYRRLPAEQQRLFRLLGRAPVTTIDADSAAVLAGLEVSRADRLLQALVDASLLNEPEPGRYRLSGLVGHYAHHLATVTEQVPRRHESVRRPQVDRAGIVHDEGLASLWRPECGFASARAAGGAANPSAIGTPRLW